MEKRYINNNKKRRRPSNAYAKQQGDEEGKGSVSKYSKPLAEIVKESFHRLTRPAPMALLADVPRAPQDTPSAGPHGNSRRVPSLAACI